MAINSRLFELKTGAKIPSIGLGTWQSHPSIIGVTTGVETWQSPPDLVGQAITSAVKVGYRHIDCAPIYGNEKEIGFALKKLFDDGVVKREEMFITSKLWHTEHEPEDVPVAFERTLQDLQLDYLDGYFIHWPVRMKKGTIGMKAENLLPADIPSTWKAMEALYDSGKARVTGVCNFSTKKLEDLLAVARIPPSVNQVECHPKWNQKKLHDFCNSKGIHLSAWSPLGSRGTPWINGNILEHPIIITIAEKLGKTPAQITLRWGLQTGHSVLPKSTNEARIKENFDIFDWSIPDQLFAKFSEIEQVRLVKGKFLIGEQSPYKTVDDLWDGEV